MRLLRHLFVCVVLVASYLPCHAAGSPWLLNADSLRPHFVWNLPAAISGQTPPEQILSLHLLRGADTAAIAVASEYTAIDGTLRMELLGSLDYGGSYILRWKGGDGPHAAVYNTPARIATEPAKLVKWYPEQDSVPANLLFFQLRFDRPMQADEGAWRKIGIREDKPGAVRMEYAWRQRSYWFDSGRVLQVMVHPGRVKTGIDYGGPLLFSGRSYILEVDSGLIDADGNTLDAQAPRRFRVFTKDEQIPRATLVPAQLAAGTKHAVELRFSEAMDHSGLLTGFGIKDSEGKLLSFDMQVDAGGRLCKLIPADVWQAGDYRLELNEELRDLGANTLRRRFEVHDIRETLKDRIPLRYRFRVR
jgi:hypothetical protein